MVIRRVSWSIVLSLLAAASAAAPLSGTAQASGGQTPSAQPLRHYINAKAHYVISYPANWKVTPSSDVDFMAKAPDHNAFLTASAIATGENVTAAQVKQQQKTVLQSLHAVAGSMTFETKSINGVVFLIGEAVARQNHRELDVILVDTVRHGYIYDFDAGVIMNAPSTAAETTLLQRSLNSITFKS